MKSTGVNTLLGHGLHLQKKGKQPLVLKQTSDQLSNIHMTSKGKGKKKYTYVENDEMDKGDQLDDDLLGEGHYWQTQVLLSLKSCEYSDVCSGASRHQPDILLKLLN